MPKNRHLLQSPRDKWPRPLLCPLTFSQIIFGEQSSPKYLCHALPELVSVSLSLILQYTCLSITAPTLQDHLRTLKRYYESPPNASRGGAKEAWKNDYKLSDTNLAALNTMRSNIVKELVQSDASQVLVDRRQRLEEGVAALRVAGLLNKVEAVRKRINGSLQKKQEMMAKHNATMQRQPASSHKLNDDPPGIMDVDAIETEDFDFDTDKAVPPTQRRSFKNMIRQVEALANEVEVAADFMGIERAKVGEEVEKLIPAWEAVKKDGDEEDERKGVGRMMTELAEAMQAVRDGVETIQSITMYAEQTDADEEAEMVKLQKDMALVRLHGPCYCPPGP
jgi:hypothetical protein